VGAKLRPLCQDLGQAMCCNAALPRHHATRERSRLRATTDYWIDAMDGQPFSCRRQYWSSDSLATSARDVIEMAFAERSLYVIFRALSALVHFRPAEPG